MWNLIGFIGGWLPVRKKIVDSPSEYGTVVPHVSICGANILAIVSPVSRAWCSYVQPATANTVHGQLYSAFQLTF